MFSVPPPISNLSFISKIIELVVAQQFISHTSASHLLPANQSPYRPFHSTETAVLSDRNDLVRLTDNNQDPALVLLDF